MKEIICPVTGQKCMAQCQKDECFIDDQSDSISTRAILLIQEEARNKTGLSNTRILEKGRGEVYSAIVRESKRKTGSQT